MVANTASGCQSVNQWVSCASKIMIFFLIVPIRFEHQGSRNMVCPRKLARRESAGGGRMKGWKDGVRDDTDEALKMISSLSHGQPKIFSSLSLEIRFRVLLDLPQKVLNPIMSFKSLLVESTKWLASLMCGQRSGVHRILKLAGRFLFWGVIVWNANSLHFYHISKILYFNFSICDPVFI